MREFFKFRRFWTYAPSPAYGIANITSVLLRIAFKTQNWHLGEGYSLFFYVNDHIFYRGILKINFRFLVLKTCLDSIKIAIVMKSYFTQMHCRHHRYLFVSIKYLTEIFHYYYNYWFDKFLFCSFSFIKSWINPISYFLKIVTFFKGLLFYWKLSCSSNMLTIINDSLTNDLANNFYQNKFIFVSENKYANYSCLI